MGDWTITITGHGIHDNGRQDDADSMAAVFAGELKAAGHQVHSCTFSLTSKDVLSTMPHVTSTHSGPVHYPNGLDDPQPYNPPPMS